MSHEIESNDSLFNVGSVPWHGLGVVLEDSPDNIKAAIEASGLGWWVDKRKMFLEGGVEVAGHYCTVRSDDESQLGVVGSDYSVLQNEDAFEWFEPMIASGLIRLVSAGSLRGGRKVWIQAEVIGAAEEVRKGDVVKQHLLMAHSHDGTMNLRGDFCGVRVVCANTLRMAHSENKVGLFRIRHTRSIGSRLDYQRSVVAEHVNEFRESIGLARRMAATPVEAEELVQFVSEVFQPDSEEALNRRVDKVIDLFESGRGNVGESVWDLYNGATEFLNWERGKDQGNRLDSLWFGEASNMNARAWAAASKLAA